jgi:hypothetical protein
MKKVAPGFLARPDGEVYLPLKRPSPAAKATWSNSEDRGGLLFPTWRQGRDRRPPPFRV